MSKTLESLTYENKMGLKIRMSADSVFHVNVSKDVEGLGCPEVENYSTNSMGQIGDTYLANRILPREISIEGKIKVQDLAKAGELRRQMARTFNPQFSGVLTYSQGDFSRVIDCRISEPPRFTRKDLLISFEMVLICHNPLWRDTAVTVIEIARWIGDWEFPFEIPPEGLQFGHREPSLIQNAYNKGDVQSGFVVEFTAKSTVKNPSLIRMYDQKYIRILTTLEAGDIITVNTKYGQKGVTFKRGTEVADAFHKWDSTGEFLQLAPGDNLMRYKADVGEDEMDIRIFITNEYWGV